jgi:hypothetical protein
MKIGLLNNFSKNQSASKQKEIRTVPLSFLFLSVLAEGMPPAKKIIAKTTSCFGNCSSGRNLNATERREGEKA